VWTDRARCRARTGVLPGYGAARPWLAAGDYLFDEPCLRLALAGLAAPCRLTLTDPCRLAFCGLSGQLSGLGGCLAVDVDLCELQVLRVGQDLTGEIEPDERGADHREPGVGRGPHVAGQA